MMHCPSCGHNNGVIVEWPFKCEGCKETLYNSPKPVVAIILRAWGEGGEPGLVIIKRGIEPHKGTWAFPGGYIDHAEDWRAASARETSEEIGIDILPTLFQLKEVVTTPTNYLVMFVEAGTPTLYPDQWADFDTTTTLNDQGHQEILGIDVVHAREQDTRSLGIPPHDAFWKKMHG